MTGSERGWLRDLLGARRNCGPLPRRARGWGRRQGLEALETRWLMAVLATPRVIEGKGTVLNTADFVIRLERPSPRPSTYSVFTGDRVALKNVDYVPLPANKTITFGPGETTQTVSVEIIDDDLIEHNEDFFLGVKGRGRTAVGRAIIIDDDALGPPLNVSNPIVPEGEGPIPASRVRFLSQARIRRMRDVYGVRIAGR